MRIARFRYRWKEYWGRCEGSKIKTNRGTFFLNKVKLLAPTAPSKIVLVGLNYRRHAEELRMPIPKEPLIFIKPPSSLCGQGDKIIYPKGVKRLDYEGELALVIKKKGRFIPESRAASYILGYTCLNDVTARDPQRRDGQWTRAKSFDTFSPVGPWLETQIDPSGLAIKTLVNGKLKQSSSTADFIFSIPRLVSFISRVMTLMPGDIISTGTPSGVGPMHPGDIVEVAIEGIGSLKNPIVSS